MGVDQRSPERLRHHYEVEKELGDHMRASTRAERTELFSRLYGELFERVPDHPRLVRRETPEESRPGVEARMAILRGHIGSDTTFLEFAPGDCRLAYEVCKQVKKVVGVDISDQRAEGEAVRRKQAVAGRALRQWALLYRSRDGTADSRLVREETVQQIRRVLLLAAGRRDAPGPRSQSVTGAGGAPGACGTTSTPEGA